MDMDSLYVPPKGTLYCSFCDKSQHEVRMLVAGPTAFIFEECTELCFQIAFPDQHRLAEAMGNFVRRMTKAT